MQWLNKLFKAPYYTSEIDRLLSQLNGMRQYNTPGKASKIAYYQSLIKKRDKH